MATGSGVEQRPSRYFPPYRRVKRERTNKTQRSRPLPGQKVLTTKQRAELAKRQVLEFYTRHNGWGFLTQKQKWSKNSIATALIRRQVVTCINNVEILVNILRRLSKRKLIKVPPKRFGVGVRRRRRRK